MSPFVALKRLFTSEAIGSAPMDDAFVQIDREALVKELRLIARGEDQGAANLPRVDGGLDAPQNDIITKIGDELDRAQIDVRNQASAYEARLADLQLIHEVGTINAAATKAAGDFDTLVIDFRNQLSNNRDAIRESYHDLKQFKEENGLTRPAHEAPSMIASAGTIAISALVEIFGNAMFLRVNDDLGYIGGIVAAILVAAINIGMGTIVGRLLWPRVSLKSSFDRGLAWALITSWIVFLLMWNLFAAHFRDAKSAGLAQPEHAAAVTLFQSPFGLEGFYSWGLFIIGIAAAVISARSAYRMDDPFPGYGERDRQHRERCEQYADEVAKANEELTKVRDDAINDAAEVKRQLGVQSKERDRIQGAYTRLCRRFEQHQDRLGEAANYLLSVYRDANRRMRTEPDPEHFSEFYTLPRTAIEPLHDTPVREADIEAAEVALSACIEDVAAAFRSSIGQFEPLDKLKAELERGTL